MRRPVPLSVCFAALVALLPTPGRAQQSPAVQAVAAPMTGSIRTRQFDGLAEGPYERLVIRGAMVIPGHGGPPAGPYD
ncbi:MAG TPA: hypothetical protein VLA43_16715, partial [Longimicrobiales bacterium]|nr:hypothetical protein [Longimicrobiales bacterium]